MTARPAVALVDGRLEVERELLAAVCVQGAPALLGLRRTPWSPTWLTGLRRIAVQAVESLALRGEAGGPVAADAIVAEARTLGAPEEIAEGVRAVVADDVEVYGGHIATPTLERLVAALADAAAAAEVSGAGPDLDRLERVLSVELLRQARVRELLSLADLPLRHGLGEDLDRALGGGLAPGDLVVVGATGAGAGKTALVMQMADGLALRSAEIVAAGRPGPLTPAVLVSELAPEVLAARTLARCAQVAPTVYVAGRTAERWMGREEVDRAYAAAEDLVRGPLAALSAWQVLLPPPADRGELLAELERVVAMLRGRVTRGHPSHDVWPLIVLDPVHRWLDSPRGEVEALTLLAQDLDALADEQGWIVLATADTTKAAATGADEVGVGALRGSMTLAHAADVVLVLDPGEPVADPGTPRAAALRAVKSRRGPTGGIVPLHWWAGRGLAYGPVAAPDPAHQVEAARAVEAEQLRRLYEVVERALPVRPALSPSWLRDQRHADLGVPMRAIEALVARAIDRGVLVVRRRSERGITLGLGVDPRQPVACPSPPESDADGIP